MNSFEFDVRTMIRGPYRLCRACSSETLGLIHVGPSFLSRRCVTCLATETVGLPEPTKTVIYLDQFAISDMMKALDPEDEAHTRTLPRWLDLFLQLDRLSKLQLIVCPDSEAHSEESSLHRASKNLKRLYEHLSNGVSFLLFEQIRARQVHAFFEAWLDEDEPPTAGAAAGDVARPDLHGWVDVLRVSVDLGINVAADVARNRARLADALAPLYEQWAAEQPSYGEVLAKEVRGYPDGTVKAYAQWLGVVEAAGAGAPVEDLESLLPGPSARLVDSLMRALGSRGVPPGRRLPTVLSFMAEADFAAVPFVEISSHLWASVARDAAEGAKPPAASIASDFNIISTLLPYCDAMLLDAACVGMLRNNPLRSVVEKYDCQLFSPRDFPAFLAYLKDIEETADPAHLELVGDVYGPTWPTPFTTILTYDRGADSAAE